VALGRPFDWAAETLGRPGDQREFGKETVARAEIAADLTGDDTHRVHRHTENARELALLANNAARTGIERIPTARLVISAHRGARLDRDAGNAIDPGLEPGHMSSLFECSADRRVVADFRVNHDIRNIVVKPRRVGGERGLWVGHSPQHIVLDDNAFGRVLRRGKRLRNNEGDSGADMTNAIEGQDVMWRDRHRRAVAIVKDDIRRRPRRGEMGNGLKPVGAGIRAGQHSNDARHLVRAHRINAADHCMGVGRAQCDGIGLSGKIEIVTVTAAARDEAQVLLATNRVPDACLHDVTHSTMEV